MNRSRQWPPYDSREVNVSEVTAGEPACECDGEADYSGLGLTVRNRKFRDRSL